jgi:hypothetical protein
VTILRIDAVGGRALDRAIAVVDSATLTRRADGCFIEAPAADLLGLTRALAFAGIAATVWERQVGDPAGLLPAIGSDLEPLPSGLVEVDVVRVRRVALGEATTELLRRRFARIRPPSSRAADRCRRLLRGEDVLLGWERRAWLRRGSIAQARAVRSIRPVVFDRGALDRDEVAGRMLMTDGALARWAFA